MATVIKDLGAVTAYAYAVEGGYTGTEEEFTALLGNIADDLSQIENLSVTVTTLPAGSSATASYSNGVLTLGIPKGDKGDKGDTGATPAFTIGTVTTLAAGNDASASITGTAAAPVLNLGIPKGADGDVSSASMATTYSSSATYAVGDYVWYSGQLYRCTTAITTAEAWTAAHWTAAKIAEDVDDLKSALTSIADVYYTSENLFDPGTFEVGKQLDSNGNLATNSNFCVSDYIPVKSGWVLNGYISPNTISGLGGWFDENKVYKGKIEELSGYTLTNRNKRYFTLVCDFDGYIRVNVYANAPYQQAMLKLNTEIDTSLSEPLCQNYHAYEPAYEKVSDLKVQTSYGKFVHENNGLFNPTKSVSGYLASDGAQVWSNANYKTSDFIPLDGNTDYLIQGITTRLCLYDSSKTNIAASFDSNEVKNRSFNSGSASFARFTYYATEESRMYVRIASEQFFDTEKGGAYFSNDNPLLGKTLYTIGDSIMEGNGNSNFGIGDILASRNSMYLRDWSKGGATIGWRDSIGNATGNIQYQATLASAETAPDYILIDGQTNDIDNASTIPVGEVGESFDSADFVKTSFAGGLETIFSTLKTAFPATKIVYVRVHHIGSRGLSSQNVRCEVAKNACFKWGIPIADIYGDGTLNTFLSQYEQYTNNADKTHPNRAGYDLFYIPLIESVLKAV